MLRFIRYKITNKKLLNSSLLIGVVMLAGFLCVYPMFREGSLNRLIQNMFIEKAQEEAVFPAVVTYTREIPFDQYGSAKNMIDDMTDKRNRITSGIDCPVIIDQRVLYVKVGNADTTFNSKSKVISMGAIPDLYEHADLVYGVKAEEADKSDNELVKQALANGAYPCVISQYVMDKYGLVVGETLSFKFKMYSDSENTDFVVTGIVEEMKQDGYFWHKRLESYKDLMILPIDAYDKLVKENEVHNTYYDLSIMFDYTKINNENAGRYKAYIEAVSKNKEIKSNFIDILTQYKIEEKSISLILFAFELPIVCLLLMFLYMISSRILEMETTEIAMLKSRGVSRLKIIGLYVIQSSFIALAGCIIGLPIGILMCRLAASTNAFLSFSLKDVSIYQPTLSMILFALLAFVLAVLFMTLPVIGLSKLTITDRKNLRISTTTPMWQKYFIDLILLATSGYLLYNYYKQKETMAVDIVAGGSVDPIIFLNSSLFILAFGLLFLRLTGYLVRLIYHLGKKRWKPAGYVAFLQIIRSAKRQGFITVFLVMTIAMGVFNANLARTVNENMENRINYNVGTDLRMQESWKLTVVKTMGGEMKWKYSEPDIGRFDLDEEYGIESRTKVLIDNKTDIKIKNNTEAENMLMAIQTKEFGQTAELDGSVNDKHWYHYLNELALNPKGVLISSNLASKYGLNVGDTINYIRYSPIDPKKPHSDTAAKKCGIVDAFPGYESTYYVTTPEGKTEAKDRYLVVANYQTVVSNHTVTPYEVWMKFDKHADTVAAYEKLKENGIEFKSHIDRNSMIQSQRDSAMIQITNGMFSVGFIISLLICTVGFMIYWVLTIKEREIFYGIYRAMGMTMGEIVTMLVTEQIFSSLLSALSGFAVGGATTLLFTKLISVVYLPKKHNMPIEIFIKAEDSIKMAVIIGAAFALCFAVMSRTVKNMNITKALKMGED